MWPNPEHAAVPDCSCRAVELLFVRQPVARPEGRRMTATDHRQTTPATHTARNAGRRAPSAPICYYLRPSGPNCSGGKRVRFPLALPCFHRVTGQNRPRQTTKVTPGNSSRPPNPYLRWRSGGTMRTVVRRATMLRRVATSSRVTGARPGRLEDSTYVANRSAAGGDLLSSGCGYFG